MLQPSEACNLSVVIPVHNGAPFIGSAVASVLAQKSSALVISQIIVVDNNSTDNTAEVMARLIATHFSSGSSVQVIATCEPRPNAANARNAGCRLAKSPWLAFLDADDLWLPGKLQRQMESLVQHPEAALSFTLGSEFHSSDLSTEQRSTLPCRTESYPLLTPSSLLLKREIFEQVGDFPDVSSGEFIAWFGWARELGFREFVIPEVLVHRRIHPHNTTRGIGAMAGYPQAAKWLLDQRRNARAMAEAGS